MPRPAARRRGPPLERLVVAVYGLFGLAYGTLPITDNSMLLHMRTGIEMVRSGAIPRRDPYSFTAGGTHWVVQSWLAEWTYGIAYRLGGGTTGLRLIVLEQALLIGAVALVGATLAKTGSMARTALTGLLVTGMGLFYWSPRPLLFGLLGLGLTILVVERRRSPLWLLPIVWVWVNTHGSFPLGLLWLGATLVGEVLDRLSDRRRTGSRGPPSGWRRFLPTDLLAYMGTFVLGLALSAVNPLGPRLLVFAVTVGDKRTSFGRIVEWRSPDFHQFGNVVGLVFLVGILAVAFRHPIRWRTTLPFLAQVALGLIAVRNLGPAALVAAPLVGRALRVTPPPAPDPDPAIPAYQAPGAGSGIERLFAAVLATAAALFLVAIAGRVPVRLKFYPEHATAFLEQRGLLGIDHRVIAQDFTGCYLIFRGSLVGATPPKVFIDDRVDLYPLAVEKDIGLFLDGKADPEPILDRYMADVVLWQRDRPLATLMARLPGWRESYRDKDYVIYERNTPSQ